MMRVRRERIDIPPVVTVIGGGFSGLLTAVHLLRRHRTVRVRLVERRPQLGEGRAYGTAAPDHLLNVRAANMSAFPDEPRHFLGWLGEGEGGDAFVSRARYGEYLQSLLAAEVQDLEAGQRLSRKLGEAVEATPFDGGWKVRLAHGHAFHADAVVLAVGFLPPDWPAQVRVNGEAAASLIADPWSADVSRIPQGEILLLGSGLTMVDMALSLAGPGRRLTALSRRGLAPLAHGSAPTAPPPPEALRSPALALRILRDHARAVGWRSAVDSIRPVTAAIWRTWPERDRRRFLRHLRPWWDIHRHRMAPAVAERVAALVESGALKVEAGQLDSLHGAPGGVDAVLRLRAQRERVVRRYAAVVNCVSLQGDPDQASEGLLADLRRQGLLRPDLLRLGLDVDESFRVLGASGAPTEGLYAVGPLTRGAVWEAVAVPDLRVHTAALARTVLADLMARGEAGPSNPPRLDTRLSSAG
ncbi:MAG: FAD/NAD(P)-binding protein [Caulobacteraceae bacterium]